MKPECRFRKTCVSVPENLRVGSINLGSVPENLSVGFPKTWVGSSKPGGRKGGNLALRLPLALADRLWQGEQPSGPLVGVGLRLGESRYGLPRGLERYRAADLEPMKKGAPREKGALVCVPLAPCALVSQLGLQKE